MKKITLCIMLCFGLIVSGQVSFTTDFESGIPSTWSQSGYSTTTSQACAGQSIRDNMYSSSTTGNLTTPSGTSNGTDVTFAFDYKIVDWSAATVATGANWGMAELQYNVNGGGFTTFHTINDGNHVTANTCATVTETITGANVPDTASVEFRILATWGTAGDYYFYIDNVSITQVTANPPNCDAALTSPADGATDASVSGDISWSAATGVPTGYDVTVGTSSGASDIYTGSLGNVTTVNVGALAQSTQYFVNIVPTNGNGAATGCTEYSFTTFTPLPGDLLSNAIPITPSAAGTGCTSGSEPFSYDFTSGYTDSGLDGTCDGTSTGLDIFFTWTATSDALIWNDGGGNPGIVIRDASGTELTCEGTFAGADIQLTGWAVGDDLIIQVYDYNTASVNPLSFCLEEFNLPQCADPTGLTATVTGETTADLTWTAGSGGTPVGFNYEIQPTGVAQGTAGAITGTSVTSPAAVTGLSSATDYDAYIQADCNPDGTSMWVGPISFTTTGPPPANDECAGALPLTVNADLSCTSITSGTIANATASAEDATACGGSEDDDVWFSFVATATSHEIELLNIAGGTTDLYHSVWEGTCGGLTLVTGTCSDPNTSSPSGLTIGNTYLLRVYSWTSTAGQTSTFDVCIGTLPPPPANDDCANAIALTAGNVFTDNPIVGTNVAATDSGETAPGCASYSGGDVWYSVVVPADGMITLEVNTQTGGITDTGGAAYSGTCGALTLIECNDDSSSNGSHPIINVDDIALAGQTIYFSVWEYSNNAIGEFQVSAYSATLGVNEFENSSAFTYFPNPVKNTLTLNAQSTIDNVTMFNMLGQVVLNTKPNSLDSELDMSNLKSGAYFVKVTIANNTKTIKVIKQ